MRHGVVGGVAAERVLGSGAEVGDRPPGGLAALEVERELGGDLARALAGGSLPALAHGAVEARAACLGDPLVEDAGVERVRERVAAGG